MIGRYKLALSHRRSNAEAKGQSLGVSILCLRVRQRGGNKACQDLDLNLDLAWETSEAGSMNHNNNIISILHGFAISLRRYGLFLVYSASVIEPSLSSDPPLHVRKCQAVLCARRNIVGIPSSFPPIFASS